MHNYIYILVNVTIYIDALSMYILQEKGKYICTIVELYNTYVYTCLPLYSSQILKIFNNYVFENPLPFLYKSAISFKTNSTTCVKRRQT